MKLTEYTRWKRNRRWERYVKGKLEVKASAPGNLHKFLAGKSTKYRAAFQQAR